MLGQSELTTHSGLQLGGLPIKLSMQAHDGSLFIAWHTEFGPHGDGTHGFKLGVGSSVNKLNFV